MNTRILALALALSFATVGCTSWWQDFKTNPVQKTESILSIVTLIKDAATIAFGQVKARLSEPDQDTYQAKWDHASLALTKAIAVVRAGVAAAAEAQEDEPDLKEAYSQVTEAIAQIEGIVHEMKGLLSAPASVAAAAPGEGVATAPEPEPVKLAAADDMDALIGDYRARMGISE